MALDLDDIADRYNIADDGSRPGDDKSLRATLAREDAALQEALRKTGAELFQTDGTVSDSGQQNRLTNPSLDEIIQNTDPNAPSPPAASTPPEYYVYDRKDAFVKAPFC